MSQLHSSEAIMPSALEVEQYSMSIRLASDGLVFALSPLQKGSHLPTHREVVRVEASGDLWRQELRDAILQRPLLLQSYPKILVYYEPSAGVLVPQELYDEGEAEIWLRNILTHPCGRADQEASLYALSYPWKQEGKVFVHYWDEEVYHFLQRTLHSPSFAPYFAQLIDRRKALSRRDGRAELCVFVRRRGFDCILVREEEQVFYNSFVFVSPFDEKSKVGELLYYIFALWQDLGLDAGRDSLCLVEAGLGESNRPLPSWRSELRIELGRRLSSMTILTHSALP
ncbi:DUF3822 family protein [Porphyromonas sp. COT-239 OH1446]|uniref:DUF3822 family protein n=1 Tax=Porphyromonas sp. COT-239 OH1446 TaxID=1515613 RepID=UPI00052DD262|nr:DUF3822 family protein [Porphyromonas sp. COT-239 OH1446]KGN69930.1 hypothetical protein HQ37_05355 [Porphyromonas sp. COT-239 OH1446]